MIDLSEQVEKAAKEIKARFCGHLEQASLFVMAHDTVNPASLAKYEAVRSRLIQGFTVVEEVFGPHEVGLDDSLNVKFIAFAIEGDALTIRNALKETLTHGWLAGEG